MVRARLFYSVVAWHMIKARCTNSVPLLPWHLILIVCVAFWEPVPVSAGLWSGTASCKFASSSPNPFQTIYEAIGVFFFNLTLRTNIYIQFYVKCQLHNNRQYFPDMLFLVRFCAVGCMPVSGSLRWVELAPVYTRGNWGTRNTWLVSAFFSITLELDFGACSAAVTLSGERGWGAVQV